jgi:hypothetical protein
MGRLPATWAERPILDRDPYAMYAEMAITTNQISTPFSEAVFQNNADKPFEVHRFIPRFLALDSEGVALATQPDQALLASLVKITIKIISREQNITKAPTRPVALTKGSAENTWEWADPEYVVRSTGFQVDVQGMAFPVISGFVSILCMFTFEGFFCVMSPASEQR